jgi:hypothetical protein
MMRHRKRLAVLCMAPVIMAAGPLPIDGPLVCSVTKAIECASDLSCGAPEYLATPPSFIHVDVDNMAVTLLAPEERRGEVSPINDVEQREDRVLLTGIDGDRSWSMMILDDGAMTLTVAAEESGFVVFGQCIPADQTRP